MWLWEWQLRHHGLRRRSEGYWQADRRYGLPADAYLSVFAHAHERPPAGGERVDVCAFHVTFYLAPDRVHFYYHEVADGVWEPGGHTSAAEIRRYRVEPAALREMADRVAAAFLAAFGLPLVGRAEEPPSGGP